MSRKVKKYLAILLAFAMMFYVVPATGFAADDGDSKAVNRIEGDNRWDTAAKAAVEQFGTSDEVIIARGDDAGNFADGLAASYLAKVKYAPILLTNTNSLPQETKKAIEDLGANKAYVLGGKLAISQAVYDELEGLGLEEVERIEGGNRFGTAAEIARMGGNVDTALAVSGNAPADSLVAGPVAYNNGWPILLVNKDNVPEATKKAIADLGITNIYVVGGNLVVSEDVYDELGAKDRFCGKGADTSRVGTSIDVAQRLFSNSNAFSIVGSANKNLADAVGAAVLGQPILYVGNDISGIEGYLAGVNDPQFTILGGINAVSQPVEDALNKLAPPVEELVVESVSAINDINVEFGGEYTLPTEVEVTLSDDSVVEVPVTWDDSTVDVEDAGKYVVEGTLDVSGLENVLETNLVATINIIVASAIDVESIEVSQTELILIEGENAKLTASVLPEDATFKNLLWSSADEDIATVNESGLVQAVKVGETTITVTDNTKTISEEILVTVKEPTIETINNIAVNVIENDSYQLPATVTATMSNGTTKECPVTWLNTDVDTSIAGTYEFEGTVEGYTQPVILTLIVEEYVPNIRTQAYSAITVNNMSLQLNINLYNDGTETVSVNKIEIYEKGKLYGTYTAQDLMNSDIDTEVLPGEQWGMSVSYKIGLWLDNSYVKYYVTVNNNSYEYQEDL